MVLTKKEIAWLKRLDNNTIEYNQIYASPFYCIACSLVDDKHKLDDYFETFWHMKSQYHKANVKNIEGNKKKRKEDLDDRKSREDKINMILECMSAKGYTRSEIDEYFFS